MRHTRDNEDGLAAAYIAIIAAAVLLMCGLLFDGAGKLSAINDAQSAAQEAGRAAGQQLTPDVITGRASTVDPGKGAAAAQNYLAQAGVNGSATVEGTTIRITTTKMWRPHLLPFLGGPVHGNATVDTQRVTP